MSLIRGFSFLKYLITLFVMINFKTHSNERNISTKTYGVMGDQGDDDGVRCNKEPVAVESKFYTEFEEMKNSYKKKRLGIPMKLLIQEKTAEMLTNLQNEDFCNYVWKKCPYDGADDHSLTPETHDILIPKFYPDHTKDENFDKMITNLSLLKCDITDDNVIYTNFAITAFPNKRILFIFKEYFADPDEYTILQYKLHGYCEYPKSAIFYANWEIME